LLEFFYSAFEDYPLPVILSITLKKKEEIYKGKSSEKKENGRGMLFIIYIIMCGEKNFLNVQ